VQLSDGSTVIADENYIRESILNSQAKIVAGFQKPSIMPTFQGLISEEQVLQLVAYIESIGTKQPTEGGAAKPQPPTTQQ
jgi:cytochrome c oxidase subunit 2